MCDDDDVQRSRNPSWGESSQESLPIDIDSEKAVVELSLAITHMSFPILTLSANIISWSSTSDADTQKKKRQQWSAKERGPCSHHMWLYRSTPDKSSTA